MKILLTGAKGQVGSELVQSLSHLGALTAVDLQELDLTDTESVVRLVDEVKPDVIVNPAAYTAVDRAEEEPERAFEVNKRVPTLLAGLAKAHNALLIHYSTDYVYPGSGDQPFYETDKTGPLNVYGRAKLAGDEGIVSIGCEYLILRTSWVYGLHGNNFVKTMLRLGEKQKHLRVVEDQVGAPTSARTLADVTALLLSRGKNYLSQRRGVYHLTNTGVTNWADFAREIFRLRGLEVQVEGISSESYQAAAKRPKNSRLSLKKLKEAFDLHPLAWETALKQMLR